MKFRKVVIIIWISNITKHLLFNLNIYHYGISKIRIFSFFIKTQETNAYDEAILTFKQKIESENQQKTINATPPSFIPNEIKDDALLALLQDF